MKKILLGGCPFGSENIGDDGILSSFINSFGYKNDQLTIYKIKNIGNYLFEYINNKKHNTLVYENRIYSKPILGVSLNGRRNPIEAIFNEKLDNKIIRNQDLVVCGGGTLISDLPWHTLRILEISKKLKVPTILFGIGMAKIKDKSSIKPLKEILNRIDDIYVRDEFVKTKLIDIGIEPERINTCYDPAITLKPNLEIELRKYLSKEEIKIYENGSINIGISLSSDIDIQNQTNFIAINKITNYLINKYNANIFLIPTYFYNDCDSIFMKALVINPKIILIKKRFEPEDLIQFLHKFNLIISSRLHLNIFSSIVGTPFIGLIRNSKVSDFSNIHNLKSYYFHNISDSATFEYIDLLIEKNEEFRAQIKMNTLKMREIHLECIQNVFKKYLV